MTLKDSKIKALLGHTAVQQKVSILGAMAQVQNSESLWLFLHLPCGVWQQCAMDRLRRFKKHLCVCQGIYRNKNQPSTDLAFVGSDHGIA